MPVLPFATARGYSPWSILIGVRFIRPDTFSGELPFRTESSTHSNKGHKTYRSVSGIVLAVLTAGTVPSANAEIIALEGFTLESSGSTQIFLPQSFGLLPAINVDYTENNGVPTSASVSIKPNGVRPDVVWEGEPGLSNGTETQEGIFFAATSSQGQEGATLVDLSGTDISEYFPASRQARCKTSVTQ